MDIFSHQNLTPVSFRRYLNKNEVCHFLRISIPTLNRWIRNCDFPPPQKVGQRIVGWPPEIVKR
ncbi:AlpA family phage regulatory protein [Enterobacteriaceae bacterium RIT711]|nr:AlpA family phage regulatory protein [Enterobacteriaceae bacterium RIT711]